MELAKHPPCLNSSIQCIYVHNKKVFITICGTVITLVILWFVTSSSMQPSRSISSNKLHSVKNEPIHVMTIVRGLKVINRTLVMLKSMLYYEGRLKKSQVKCNLNTTLLLQCQGDLQSTSNRIDLHFLVDDEADGAIKRLISHWRLDNVNVRTYRMDKYLEQFKYVPNRHVAGVTPLLKLVIPTILPVSVEKVIFIDTDTLFHANVKQLWDYFDQFDDEQVIFIDTDTLFHANVKQLWDYFEKFDDEQLMGLALEQVDGPSYCGRTVVHPIPCPGINTGVMLLHLKKLRGYAWDSMWRQVIKQETSGGRFLRVGEQQVMNGIIAQNPKLYYHLPCEWNVQLCFDSGPKTCPVVWPINDPNNTNCDTMRISPFPRVKLTHHNTSPKPGDDAFKTKTFTSPDARTGLVLMSKLIHLNLSIILVWSIN
ncbi:hypothetical protein P879_11297 [Paragonimus westermani]|uniref:Glycosyltransferase-like protein LARGE n=1 Tax=Paragonimus westermani TaxID=34504 RepID=A0A8T0D769_9TREM|nr:hypothetical protein P879_11297 [Paragonimus westermani]